MSGIDNNMALRLSLIDIKETGFSIRPDLRESDVEKVEWMIGFRPVAIDAENQIAVEVRSVALNGDSRIEVASCSVLVTFIVENMSAFVKKESDMRVNINDNLMLNMLNPACGTLRGVMYARFSGTLLGRKPLPLIDVVTMIKAARKE